MNNIMALLTVVVSRLGALVAAHIARDARSPYAVLIGTRMYVEVMPPPRHKPIPAETWRLLTLRLQLMLARFTRLVTLWQQGRLPKPRRPTSQRTGQRAPYIRLPRERGWINRRVAGAGEMAGLYHATLHNPELPAFIAEVPRAARLLRPLAHAFALDRELPDCLKLPPLPRPPRRASSGSIRREAAAPLVRPLQPYVRAAVRHAMKNGRWD